MGTSAIRARASARALLTVTVLVLSCLALLAAPHKAAASTAGAGSLAAANVGKTAGTCAVHPSTNTLGGSQFETSCTGVADGLPEYWCADFVKWAWRHSSLNITGLTPSAESFRTYGSNNGTFHSSAQVGDAITFASSPGARANHVAIVTAVGSDGSVTVANGDWGGVSGSGMHYFAETSSVVSVTIPASVTSVNSYVSSMHYYITAIIGAAGSGGGSNPPPGGNPYTATGLCGANYGVIDSHRITGATIFLLYDDSTGNNCVTTLADSDDGAVSMNATLAVQGGSSGSDPGSYHWYAGPVSEHAPNSCVQWGGTYKTSSWTSGWSHCGGSGGAPVPVEVNPNTPESVCGSGYSVIDQHQLSGATVYLLYNNGTGKNCAVTLATDISGAVSMKATLAAQGGSSYSDSGTYTYYAGPLTAYAPNSCVQWGGTYKTSSWTSAWSHCGSNSVAQANPYTATGVCGSGYSVIDQHDLGSATIYLLYNAGVGKNCVATLVHNGDGAVGLNATLAVQNGSSASNPGLFEWYAGPVRLAAASACVKWGGSYESTSWTSAWSHCG